MTPLYLDDFKNVTQAHMFCTTECNLRCKHCSISASPNCKSELNVGLADQFIKDISTLSINKLFITGGEPFFHSNLKGVFEIIDENKNDIEVTLCTNGIIIEKDYLDMMDRYVDSVCVSIDGYENEHDYLRGEGTFKKLNYNLERLRYHTNSLVANVLLWDRNKKYIDRFIEEIIETYSFNRVNVLQLRPFGRAFTNINYINKQSTVNNPCYKCFNPKEISIFPDGKVYSCYLHYSMSKKNIHQYKL